MSATSIITVLIVIVVLSVAAVISTVVYEPLEDEEAEIER